MRFLLTLPLVTGLLTSAPGAHPSDALLDLTIENALLRNDAVDAHDIDVSVASGVVTLSGQVGNLLEKSLAIDLAGRYKGVKAVVDQTTVNQTPVSDKDLKVDLFNALRHDPATLSAGLDIEVDNGRATIAGDVESTAEKLLVMAVARSVAGLAGIKFELRVRPPEVPRSDVQLEREIERLLAVATDVAGAEVRVDVIDGLAVLNGTVRSDLQRQRVIRRVQLAGVEGVDDRGLAYEWEPRGIEIRDLGDREIGDEEIERALRTALRANPRTTNQAEGIATSSRAGEVTLTGAVTNLATKNAASEAARNTVGVVRVDNRLRVERPDPPVSDTEIVEGAHQAMARDAYLAGEEIIVRSRNAHVQLFGLVATDFLMRRASDIIGVQPGVVHVANYLTVLKEWQPRPDEEIKAAIEQELRRILFAPHAQVNVMVEDGVAILTGKVQSWLQWQMASDIATEAGARRPHNLIRIDGRRQP